jgi:hypothetical protein
LNTQRFTQMQQRLRICSQHAHTMHVFSVS